MHNSPASTDDAIVKGRSRPRSVSRRTAVFLGCLIWIVAVPMAHGVAPWAISLLAGGEGWTRDREPAGSAADRDRNRRPRLDHGRRLPPHFGPDGTAAARLSDDARPVLVFAKSDVCQRAGAVARMGGVLRERRRVDRSCGLLRSPDCGRALRGACAHRAVRRGVSRVHQQCSALAWNTASTRFTSGILVKRFRMRRWISITHFGCSWWSAFSCCFRSACITG